MAITQIFLNLDTLFRTTPGPKIIVNDLDYFSLTDNEKITQHLMTVYNNVDVISIKPQCDCGEISGAYNIGRICNQCSTECKDPEFNLDPIIWVKSIDPKLKFLNPTFWNMLSNMLDTKVDYIRWLTDSKYNPRGLKVPSHILTLKKDYLDDKRDYYNTMANIDKIINFISMLPKYKAHNKQEQLTHLLKIYHDNKDILFSDVLPIVNKKLLVMENTTKGRFTNMVAADVIDVVKQWMKLCSDDNPSEKDKSNATGCLVSKLAHIYLKYFNDYLIRKEGVIRKQIYGFKSHFTCRFVIRAIPDKHDRRELHMPWVAGCICFRPHILNKLVKRGYKRLDAFKKVYAAVKKYDPVVDEILQELITDSPHLGIPVLANRNPSLAKGSILLMYITKFNKDPLDYSCGISHLIIDIFNGDYDGVKGMLRKKIGVA